MEGVLVRTEGHRLRTQGLAAAGLTELALEVEDGGLIEAAAEVLERLAAYAGRDDVRLQRGETVGLGMWLLQLGGISPQVFEVLALDPLGHDFSRHADLAVRCWWEQHGLCHSVGAVYDPPNPDSLVVVSAGVPEGDPVQGVRYPSPPHMSGWWITTDRYDGDVRSLQQVHAPHVAVERPDLMPLLALPVGYRFETTRDSDRADVWFDEEAAKSADP